MDEKQKKRKSILITSVVQLVVLLVLYFAIAWKEPFPPIPEYGIELSFGVDQQNTETAAAPQEETQEEDIEEAPPEDEAPENEPTTTEQEPVPQEETETQQEQQPAEEPSTTEDPLSPDEQPAEVKEKVTPEAEAESRQQEEKAEENPQQSEPVTVDEPSEEKAGEPTEEPKIDERALYSESTSGEGENRGATLQMTGWRLSGVPDPNDTSQETGQIVFEIKVDSDGYVVSIRTLTSTVTPAVERLYRNAVEQLVLEKTADYEPAPVSTGKITFILKAR